ncbi:MAG: hypothetical protein M1832_002384 [Thelocarpon impressellum]|nr:MAG: hypothetical protein M1832_002384 [Thelocarpon impressellum]
MATDPPGVVDVLRSYSTAARPLENNVGSARVGGALAKEAAAYEARVDRALGELQRQVQEQEAILGKLRESSSLESFAEPSPDPIRRLRQLQVLTTAYQSLTIAEPRLPPPDSPLPALLALRNTDRLISETKTSIAEVQERLAKAQTLLEKEEADLRDAHLIATGLSNRINNLRARQAEKSQKSPSETAKDLVRDLQRRKQAHEREVKRLVKAFNEFIDVHLAGMLAAEELGGPVVGELPDVDDAVLEAGFSQHGRAKKRRPPSAADDSRRQQRIDQIWGPAECDADSDADSDQDMDRSERVAAGAELRALTEELLNASAASSSSGSAASAYVELPRDSAAVRFLVRTKVAQFHPRDARRLRLVDFGRDLDD